MKRKPRFGEILLVEMVNGDYKKYKVIRFGRPDSVPIYRLPLDPELPELISDSQRDELEVVLVADDEQTEVQLLQILLDEDDYFKIESNGSFSDYKDNDSFISLNDKTYQTLLSDILLELIEAQKEIFEHGLNNSKKQLFDFCDLQTKLEYLSLFSMINSSNICIQEESEIIDTHFEEINTVRREMIKQYQKLNQDIINYNKLVQVQSRCRDLLGKGFGVGNRLPEFSRSSTRHSFMISRIIQKDHCNEHVPFAQICTNGSYVTVSSCQNAIKQRILEEHPELKKLLTPRDVYIFSDSDYDRLIECIMETARLDQLVQDTEK